MSVSADLATLSTAPRRCRRLVTLKSRLFAAGLTQRAVSLRAGIPETRLSSILNGRARASRKERAALSRLLNTPESVLFAPYVDLAETS
jgi:transcriptional regulator with XRE-family HTH domain